MRERALPTWLRYAAAYALWLAAIAGAYLVVDLAREAALAASIVLSGGNPYVVRFVDRAFFVVAGLGWLGFAVAAEGYLRDGVRRNDLTRRGARLAGGVALVLFAAQAAFVLATPGAATAPSLAILAGALISGVALLALTRGPKRKLQQQGRTS